MRQIKVLKLEEGQTIEKYIKKLFINAPLSLIYKYFRTNKIKLNNKKAKLKDKLKEDDIIKIFVSDEDFDSFVSLTPLKEGSDKIKKYIIYEDENIIVVNKPAKMLVQAKDNKEKSLTELMQEYTYYSLKDTNINFFFSAAHRIDRNTSGLIIFGKSIKVLQELSNIFKDHEQIEKHYLTLVKGNILKEGKIDVSLYKDKNNLVRPLPISEGGKTAITLYKPIKQFDGYTLLDVVILTGRTHQIRAHLKYINHPIIGDPKYGDFNINKLFEDKYSLKWQFLHSYQIIFKIRNGMLNYLNNLEFIAPLDDKLNNILLSLENIKGD